MKSVNKVLSKFLFHCIHNFRNGDINKEWNADHKATDQNCEKHLVLLSLLNALLPNMELKTGLLTTTCISKWFDILEKPTIDTL